MYHVLDSIIITLLPSQNDVCGGQSIREQICLQIFEA